LARDNDLPWRDRIYQAVDEWRQRCLYNDGSLSGDHTLWSLENITALHDSIKDFELDDRRYWDKLEGQIGHKPNEVIELAAQTHWFLYLFPLGKTLDVSAKIRAETKRQNIHRIQSWAGSDLEQSIPPTFYLKNY